MSKWTRLVMLPLLLLVAWLGGATSHAHERNDDSDTDSDHKRRATPKRERAVHRVPPSAELTLYREECGSCHLAYPPGLLPRRSWQGLMTGLDDHFGEDASLDENTRDTLSVWLGRYAAESGSHERSRKVLRGVGAAAPLRISTLPYIVRKHDEIEDAVWQRPTVVSRANCTACHQRAEEWELDEDSVTIPKP